MLKLLLQSDSVENASHIKTLLEKNFPYQILLSFSLRDTEDMLSSQSIQALIYEPLTLTASDFQFTRELRSLGVSQPILIIARPNEIEPYLSISEKYKIHFLEKPYEFKALRGLTRKIMVQRTLQQQIHRRYRTNQSMQVEMITTGATLDSHMFNLSKGGTYGEFTEKPAALTIGDLVRLRVRLDNLDRDYSMNARVVWLTRQGIYSGGHGVGFEFIKNEDIYRQLKEKV